MFLVKRKSQVVYEDLLRELEMVEQQLMAENSAAAMSLMVLEAKLRDRFQQMELHTQASPNNEEQLLNDNLLSDDIEALIPRDLPALRDAAPETAEPRTLHTVGLAAVLAAGTASAVFGLATALQFVLSWLA